MEHHSSFVTGFLSGQRLKRWQADAASGSIGGTSFYGWAAQAGAPAVLTDPGAYSQAALNMPFSRTLNGNLIWQSSVSDLYRENTAPFAWLPVGGNVDDNDQGFRVHFTDQFHIYPKAADNYSGIYNGTGYCEITNMDGHAFHFLARHWSSYPIHFVRLGLRVQLKAPVAGVYRTSSAFPAFDGNVSVANGNLIHVTYFHSGYQQSVHPGGYIGIETLKERYSSADMAFFSLADGFLYLPTFEIQPSDPNPDLQARPGLLNGSPVSENAKTFTNPITGEIIPFETFEYNYVTRTYTLTLPGGDTMEVAFGDNTIQIRDLRGGDGPGSVMEAMYPDNSGAPVYAPPGGGGYDTGAFLAGLAAGMASAGW